MKSNKYPIKTLTIFKNKLFGFIWFENERKKEKEKN